MNRSAHRPATQRPCLDPAHHAAAAHPGNAPQPQPAGRSLDEVIAGIRGKKIKNVKNVKNWVIAFLGLMIIGLAGNLHDKQVEINDLKSRPAAVHTVIKTQDQVRSYNDGWQDAKADDGK